MKPPIEYQLLESATKRKKKIKQTIENKVTLTSKAENLQLVTPFSSPAGRSHIDSSHFVPLRSD